MGNYNLKYWLEYYNLENDFFRCDILQLDYEGDILQINGKCTHKYNKRKDLNDVIVSSSLSIDLEANVYVSLQDLYSEEEQTFQVKFYRNNQLIFVGFIKPDGIYEDWVSDKWVLSLDCYDGLNILKDLSFVRNDGLFFTEKMSEFEAIYYALIRTKIDLPINISINVFNDKFNPSDYHTILNQVFINTDRYYQDVEKEKIMDCEEVIKSILDTYNACIFQQNGEWYIMRPIDTDEIIEFKRFVEGSYDSDSSIYTNRIIGSHINSTDNYFDAIHCNNNQRKSISASCQAFRVHYKYGNTANLIDNPNLKLGNGLNISGFTVVNSEYQVFRNDSGFGIWTYSEPIGANYFFSPILIADPISVGANDEIEISITFGNEGFSYGMPVQLETNNYILVNGFVWKKKSEITNELPMVLFENSWSSFFEGQNQEEDGFFPVGLGKKTVKINTVMPETGSLNIKIGIDLASVPAWDYPGKFAVYSINANPKKDSSGIKGEYHDAQFKKRKATKTKNDKVVYNGDTYSEVYYGTLLNEEKNPLEAKWYRQGFDEERELLSIAAEDNLRIAPRPMQTFEGDIYGYIPFLSLIQIDNLQGKYLPIDYTYNTYANTIKLESREFLNDPLEENSFTVEKSYDYGNTTKVTIKS